AQADDDEPGLDLLGDGEDLVGRLDVVHLATDHVGDPAGVAPRTDLDLLAVVEAPRVDDGLAPRGVEDDDVLAADPRLLDRPVEGGVALRGRDVPDEDGHANLQCSENGYSIRVDLRQLCPTQPAGVHRWPTARRRAASGI